MIPLIYKSIRPLGTLRFAVENSENRIGLFGEDGKPVTDFSIDSVSHFYRGFAIVYQNYSQGLIDRNGIIKLEAKYNSIHIDEEGKVSAQLPNQWFFLNKKNESIRQLSATQVKPIAEGRFIIQNGNASGIAGED